MGWPLFQFFSFTLAPSHANHIARHAGKPVALSYACYVVTHCACCINSLVHWRKNLLRMHAHCLLSINHIPLLRSCAIQRKRLF